MVSREYMYRIYRIRSCKPPPYTVTEFCLSHHHLKMKKYIGNSPPPPLFMPPPTTFAHFLAKPPRAAYTRANTVLLLETRTSL